MKVLDQKLKKVTELRTDSAEMLESLDALSTFYGQKGNTLESRRQLRSDLENEGLRLAREFIEEFSDIEHRFESLESTLAALHAGCTGVRQRLEATESRTAQFVARAEELRQQRLKVESRSDAVKAFLSTYQLTEPELEALYSVPLEADNGKRFFAALGRLDDIRQECKALISSSLQSLGIEILEDMAKHQEAVYERLLRWVQAQCQALAREAGDVSDATEQDVQPLLKHALKVLLARPSYYRHCQDCVASTRRSVLVRRFINALTKGGPNGFPRPIEVHAHDPLRYLGDMLAWVHQAMASEREIVMGLFGGNTPAPSTSATPSDVASELKADGPGDADADSAAQMDPVEVLDRIFDGVVRPLKVRVDQVLLGSQDMVLVFKLADILAFYATTMLTMMPPTSTLVRCIVGGKDTAWKRFFDILTAQSTRLLQSAGPYPSDLKPSRYVMDSLTKLNEILDVYNRSMVPVEEREESFAPVLIAFLDPLVQACRQSSEGLGLSDTAVFMLNNIVEMQSVLMPFDFTTAWVHRLTNEMQQWEDTLVREEAQDLLSRVGISAKLRAIQSHDGSTPLSTIAGLDAATFSVCLKAFYAALFSLSMPSFERLTSPRIRVRARRGMSQLIANAYVTVYEAMMDTKNEYPNAAAELVPHTPAQVYALLDLDR